ncbi:DUF6265 family protein [Phenylobacterium conjunctum]|jgi:hypothetical protein|uniref:DUF6265 family protein n=1 Tax=Phenylobacterium conjunctum TaxID=1298959 RepID=A0ABW3SXI1_9CAUL
MRFLLAGAAALSLAASTGWAAEPTDPLAWYDGTWCTPVGPRQICERWGPPMAGLKVGTSQAVKDGKTVEIELVTIDISGPKAQVQVAINGRPPIPFAETARTATSMTFENPNHDYPQRIRYWREGELLKAEISMLDGSRANGWSFTRVQ